jgi:hypothetical protein
MVWTWVLAWGAYAVLTLDAEATEGPVEVPIDYAWVSTDAAGATFLNAYPSGFGPHGCGTMHVLSAVEKRQAIGLRLVATPPSGPLGHHCALRIPSVRLDDPVDGRRVVDLVAGVDLTSRGPLSVETVLPAR